MTRRQVASLLACGTAAAAGCHLLHRIPRPGDREALPPPPVTYSHYRHPSFDWAAVNRVLVLPPLNASEYTRAGDEVLAALAAEMQTLGRFEVVVGPEQERAAIATRLHRGGAFDEGVLLDLGRNTRADVIVAPTVSRYSPYPRPRLGLVLQAIAPRDGKVIASVDGLWDAADARVAEQAKAFYRQRPPKRAWRRNVAVPYWDEFAADLVLDSPQLFQRYVASTAAGVLVGDPDTIAAAGAGAPPNTGSPPPTGAAPAAGPCETCPPTGVASPADSR